MEKDKMSSFVGLTFLGLVLFVGFGFAVQSTTKVQPMKQQFQVVNKYNGCDVVRYESGQYPKYVYLLNCKK